MEEAEVPTEKLTEDIHEHARESKERWQGWVALTTAIVAAVAAVTSLLAGKFETEALLESVNKNDQWLYYQAKGIKAEVDKAWVVEQEFESKPVNPKFLENVERYKREQKVIQETALKYKAESDAHIYRHESLAAAVTMYQIAIAMAAISILTKRRLLFGVSLIFVAFGIFFFFQQFLPAPARPAEPGENPTPPAIEQPHAG